MPIKTAAHGRERWQFDEPSPGRECLVVETFDGYSQEGRLLIPDIEHAPPLFMLGGARSDFTHLNPLLYRLQALGIGSLTGNLSGHSLASLPGARAPSLHTNLAETLRICTVLLQPFMPTTCEKIFAQLNVEADGKTWDSAAAFGTLPANATLHKGENIFPRIDAAKELAELEALEAAQKAAAQAANAPAEEKEEKPAESGAASAELIGEHEEEITFDDFCKVELRVAEVRACERMKESKKLLHLTVFDGERERCILSGIAKWFAPEDLIGKKIGIVANLAPRPMMKGKYVSEGMIFAADTDVDGGCSIAFFPDNTPAGARIH